MEMIVNVATIIVLHTIYEFSNFNNPTPTFVKGSSGML